MALRLCRGLRCGGGVGEGEQEGKDDNGLGGSSIAADRKRLGLGIVLHGG